MRGEFERLGPATATGDGVFHEFRLMLPLKTGLGKENPARAADTSTRTLRAAHDTPCGYYGFSGCNWRARGAGKTPPYSCAPTCGKAARWTGQDAYALNSDVRNPTKFIAFAFSEAIAQVAFSWRLQRGFLTLQQARR